MSTLESPSRTQATAFKELTSEGDEFMLGALLRKHKLRVLHSGAKISASGSYATGRRVWNGTGGSSEALRSTVVDLTTLASCRALVVEQEPVRSTYAMVAALMGGLRPCAALARRASTALGAAVPPSTVLCQRSVARAHGQAWEEREHGCAHFSARHETPPWE